MSRPCTTSPRTTTVSETLHFSPLSSQTVFLLSFSFEGQMLCSQNYPLVLPAPSPPGFPPDRGLLCRRSFLDDCKAEGSRPRAEASRSPQASSLDPSASFPGLGRSGSSNNSQGAGPGCHFPPASDVTKDLQSPPLQLGQSQAALPLQTPTQVGHPPPLMASLHSTFWNFCPHPLHPF